MNKKISALIFVIMPFFVEAMDLTKFDGKSFYDLKQCLGSDENKEIYNLLKANDYIVDMTYIKDKEKKMYEMNFYSTFVYDKKLNINSTLENEKFDIEESLDKYDGKLDYDRREPVGNFFKHYLVNNEYKSGDFKKVLQKAEEFIVDKDFYLNVKYNKKINKPVEIQKIVIGIGDSQCFSKDKSFKAYQEPKTLIEGFKKLYEENEN